MISALIIAHNESGNIERCLRSLGRVSDEIVVLDSGSTDNTVELARALGAQVHVVDWQGYSKTKNLGHTLCSHDYVLSIDADEEISIELELSLVKERRRGLKGAYRFDRHNFYMGKWIKTCGWYPDYKVRLYDRRKAHWEGDYVHETLSLQANSGIITLEGALNHYSVTSVRGHRLAALKYAKLAAREMASKNKSGGMVYGSFAFLATFLKKYLIQLGFTEGKRGWNLSYISALSRYCRYHYLAEERKRSKFIQQN